LPHIDTIEEVAGDSSAGRRSPQRLKPQNKAEYLPQRRSTAPPETLQHEFLRRLEIQVGMPLIIAFFRAMVLLSIRNDG
jgi:hypothetical protein